MVWGGGLAACPGLPRFVCWRWGWPALEGRSEDVGVADGGRCEGGVPWVWGGWAGWVAGVLRVHIDVWLALVGLGRAGGARWLLG